MYREDIFDVIDGLARADKQPDSNSFLLEFLRAAGVANVAYVAFNLQTRSADRLVSTAYATAWRKVHAQAGRVDLKAVLQAGLGGIAPLNWRLLDRDDPVIAKLLDEVMEFDVGADGFSVPLRGRDGEYALFSACLDEVALSSATRRPQDLMRRLSVTSAIFHSMVRNAYVAEEPSGAQLSDRQLTCLRLRALRTSDDEMGQILGVSPIMTRFWLETARARLNAFSVDDAVDKACRALLIRLDAEFHHAGESLSAADARWVDRREQ